MFDIHKAMRLLDCYAREGCKACVKAPECVLQGKPDLACRHGQALHEVSEFHRNVQNGFKVTEAKFLIEVTKMATDNKTELVFGPGDVFIIKGEFSQNQYICREKGPGGQEFTLTKKTEGSVWQRIL